MSKNNSFKLPEKDKKILSQIEKAKEKKGNILQKISDVKSKYDQSLEAQTVVNQEVSKKDKLEKALGSAVGTVGVDYIPGIEKQKELLEKQIGNLEKEQNKLNKELNATDNTIKALHEKVHLMYFIECQNLYWNLHKDSVENGNDNSDKIKEIHNLLFVKRFGADPKYTAYMNRAFNKWSPLSFYEFAVKKTHI